MAALPADIARYTTNGIVVTSPVDEAVTNSIQAEHVDARSGAGQEIEMFYSSPADAQAMLDERFSYLRKVNPLHLGIEVEEAIDLGGTIVIAPAVPTFRVVDEATLVDAAARVRAYAYDMASDRFSIEVMA